MRYFIVLYLDFKIWYVFYTYSTIQFQLATFPMLNISTIFGSTGLEAGLSLGLGSRDVMSQNDTE